MRLRTSIAFVHRTTNCLRLTSSATIWSICGCISGSPPAMDTIGAPDSITAPTACSTGIRCLSTSCGCWILPQPAHARLHANSGSSSTTSGNFLLRSSFCFATYVPTRIACRNGHRHYRRTSLGSVKRTVSVVTDRSDDVQPAEAAEGVDQLSDEFGRGGRPGGHADRGDARPASPAGPHRRRRRGTPALPHAWRPRRAVASSTSSPSPRPVPARRHRRRRAPPAGGWWWRSRCRLSSGPFSAGNFLRSADDDAFGFVHGERGLHQVADLVRIRHLNRVYFGLVLDEDGVLGFLAERALRLLVAGVPDEQDRVALPGEPACLVVHLSDQWTCRVHHVQPAPRRLLADARCDAVRGEHHRGALGHLVQFLDEHRAAALQVGHDDGVVHDLLAHVDRRPTWCPAAWPRCRWPVRRRRRTIAGRPAAPCGRRPRPPTPPAPGPTLPSTPDAVNPAPTVAGCTSGWLGVSTTTRTTANGRPSAASASTADSMSTTSAPVAASAVRSVPCTTWSAETIGPSVHGEAGGAERAGQQRRGRARHRTGRRAGPRWPRRRHRGRGRRSARHRTRPPRTRSGRRSRRIASTARRDLANAHAGAQHGARRQAPTDGPRLPAQRRRDEQAGVSASQIDPATGQ